MERLGSSVVFSVGASVGVWRVRKQTVGIAGTGPIAISESAAAFGAAGVVVGVNSNACSAPLGATIRKRRR